MTLYESGECVTLLDIALEDSMLPVLGQPTLEQMQRMQSFLATFPQQELTPNHYFAEGMYCRELPIPADTYVVGKIHRHEHVVVLTKGTAMINTDRGMERISAPHVWISPPGAKRVLHTETDCVFMTVHLNPENTKDLAALEADIIVPECIHDELPQLADEIQGVYA